MIAVKLLSQAEVIARLKAAGFKDSSQRFSGKSGDYSIWLSDWGEPLMVPEEGPDKMCANWVLEERIAKVLATKSKKK